MPFQFNSVITLHTESTNTKTAGVPASEMPETFIVSSKQKSELMLC